MMKIKDMRRLPFMFVLTLWLSVTICYAQFAGGDGTEQNPWQIETADHLNNVRNYLGENHANRHFILTADIELGEAPWNEGEGWVPIGNAQANAFQGYFDGDGYSVDNLTIERPNGSNQALFGFAIGATIKNLAMQNVYVEGRTTVAGLVADLRDGTNIEACYVSGELFAEAMHGGFIGGLAGQMRGEQSSVINSYTTANTKMIAADFGMTPNPLIAGLVALHVDGDIRNCYAVGHVVYSGVSSRTGALIGQSGNEEGLAGLYWNRETSGQERAIGQSDSFGGNSTAELVNEETFDGFDFDEVWNTFGGYSYPYLDWQDEPESFNIPGPVALVATAGNERAHLNWQAPLPDAAPEGYNIYRDGELVNQQIVNETNYEDTDLNNNQFYIYFVTAVYEDHESTGSVETRIAPVAYAGGTGTADDPYLIETAAHLNEVRYSPDGHFRQIADIDLGQPPWSEGEGWQPIGVAGDAFQGNYDGNSYRIYNLAIDREDNNQGLFGYTEGAVIEKVNIVNAKINAQSTIGGIVAIARDTEIRYSSAKVDINGTRHLGGLVAESRGETTINQSYSDGIVRLIEGNSQPLGGLVATQGENSSIIDSYSTAAVIAVNRRVGGLVGYSATSASIIRSYAAGHVYIIDPLDNYGGLIGQNWDEDEVINSYWNTESTGQPESDGGTGLNTQQMTSQNSFNGFNFNTIWAIDEGSSYPYLQWQDEWDGHNRIAAHDLVVQPHFGNQTVNLSWQMRGQPSSYNIYRNGELIGSTNHPQNEWSDTDPDLYVYYEYRVRAVYERDEEELESSYSNPAFTTVVHPFAGGIGTAEQPYQVETANHLNNVRYLLDSHFIQVDDIDLDEAPWNEGEGWLPIGSEIPRERFLGSYDGDNYLIENLYINRDDNYQSLFAYIDNATLQNIRMERVDVTGHHYVAGLAAYQRASAIINCSSTGSVTSNGAYAGGLVSQSRYGEEDELIISGCYSSAEVTGNNNTGGLVGSFFEGQIINSWAIGDVEGGLYVGGLVGINRGIIRDSYARGNAQGERFVGGFAGRNMGDIYNSYSTGTVDADQDIGGFLGSNTGEVAGCYWDVETSDIDVSAAGHSRLTRQMVYPYDQQTYLDWDFEDAWVHDTERFVNNGYPFSAYHVIEAMPRPTIATNPRPSHQTINVAVDIDSLYWEYRESPLFTNPVGFRVYLNTTGDFADEDDFVWVPYIDDQVSYYSTDILPEFEYLTEYYWKVVPTTQDPNRRRYAQNRHQRGNFRNDAQDVPVWRFRTEPDPKPTVATDPDPEHQATEIPINLEDLKWRYESDPAHVNPRGFRVYLNKTGEFAEDDDFVWVPYIQNVSNYSSDNILDDGLEFDKTYYWKVVPTTITPEQRNKTAQNRNRLSPNRSLEKIRGDADDVSVWHFTTIESSPHPLPAINPDPEHMAVGISTGLAELGWEYETAEHYAEPVGFRVYMNISGNFPPGADFEWVEFVPDQNQYSASEIIDSPLFEMTTYYWRIVPTTEHPENRTTRMQQSRKRIDFSRNDAQDILTWRFTTATTSIEHDQTAPLQAELHRNYPNPFNPHTVVSFSVPEESTVKIEIFNSQGQFVRELIDEAFTAGKHSVVWDGTNTNGVRSSSGIYYYRMTNKGHKTSRRMVMVQ